MQTRTIRRMLDHPSSGDSLDMNDNRAAGRRSYAGKATRGFGGAHSRRALWLWPRLDQRRLARCHDDPELIAFVAENRTLLSHETIVRLLIDEDAAEPVTEGRPA